MKKLYSLLMILAMVATFSACSKDDTPSDLPKDPIAAKLTKVTETVANKNSAAIATAEFGLTDYKELEGLTKWVKKGTINTKVAEIKFSNLPTDKENFKLTKVKMSLVNNPNISLTLPDITSEISFSDPNHHTFLQSLLDDLVSKKKSNVKIEFESNELISAKPLKISINLDARFDFK